MYELVSLDCKASTLTTVPSSKTLAQNFYQFRLQQFFSITLGNYLAKMEIVFIFHFILFMRSGASLPAELVFGRSMIKMSKLKEINHLKLYKTRSFVESTNLKQFFSNEMSKTNTLHLGRHYLTILIQFIQFKVPTNTLGCSAMGNYVIIIG